MQLAQHHRLGLAGAALLSAMALADAGVVALSGDNLFSEGGTPWVVAAGGLGHAVAYLLLLRVLWAERHRVAVNRVAGGAALALGSGLVAMAVAFGVLSPFAADDALPGALDGVFAAVAGLGFAAHFLGAIVLGLSTVRRPELRPGSAVLLLVLPAIGMIAGLAAMGSPWAHPAYAEVAVALGVALLGTATPARVSGPAARAAAARAGSR